MNEHPSVVWPADVGSAEGRCVGAQRSVREDLDRAEPEPRIAEPGAESSSGEGSQHGVSRHRIHSDAESSDALEALVCRPPRTAHDIVDRGDPEPVRHPRDRGKAALDPCLAGLESEMELSECVLRQESGRTAGCVDFKSPHAGEARGPLEGHRIQRADVAVDPPSDDGVVGRYAIEILSRQEASLGPFRLVPIDSDDPAAVGGRSRCLAESYDRILEVARAIEPRPSAFARGIGHVGVRVDETRHDDGATKVDEGRAATPPPLPLRRRPDGQETVAPNREGLRPRPISGRCEDLAVDEDNVRVARHLSARPANPGGARSLRGASRLVSRT